MAMELPYWLKVKNNKTCILIYDVKRRKLYRTDSYLLYFIFKLHSLKFSKIKIIKHLTERFGIPIHNAQKMYSSTLSQLKTLVEGKNVENCDNFEDYTYNSCDYETPLAISLLLTYKCNLKCRHCLVGNFRYNKFNEMKLSEIENLAAQMEQYEVFKVALNGGEPLVRRDFREILKAFYGHKIPIEISTNGVELSKKMIELMNEYNVVGYTLSIEGANAKTHDFIRGAGTFNKVLSAISIIKKYSTAFELNVEITYGKHNLNQVDEIIKILADLGMDKIKFARLKPWNWGAQLSYLIPTLDDVVYLNEKIWNLQEKYINITAIEGDVPKSPKTPLGMGCNITVGFEIMPSGVVLPCRIFEQNPNRNIILGNIRTNNIFEIWSSPKAKIIRRYARELCKKIFCPNCKFTHFCPTKYCIAENYLRFGNFIPTGKSLRLCKI